MDWPTITGKKRQPVPYQRKLVFRLLDTQTKKTLEVSHNVDPVGFNKDPDEVRRIILERVKVMLEGLRL